MPIITMLAVFLNFTYTSSTQVLTLIFWPSSIFLMSLGGNPRPIEDQIYVYSISIGCNIILYLVIGVVFYLLRSCVRKQGNENL